MVFSGSYLTLLSDNITSPTSHKLLVKFWPVSIFLSRVKNNNNKNKKKTTGASLGGTCRFVFIYPKFILGYP